MTILKGQIYNGQENVRGEVGTPNLSNISLSTIYRAIEMFWDGYRYKSMRLETPVLTDKIELIYLHISEEQRKLVEASNNIVEELNLIHKQFENDKRHPKSHQDAGKIIDETRRNELSKLMYQKFSEEIENTFSPIIHCPPSIFTIGQIVALKDMFGDDLQIGF